MQHKFHPCLLPHFSQTPNGPFIVFFFILLTCSSNSNRNRRSLVYSTYNYGACKSSVWCKPTHLFKQKWRDETPLGYLVYFKLWYIPISKFLFLFDKIKMNFYFHSRFWKLCIKWLDMCTLSPASLCGTVSNRVLVVLLVCSFLFFKA